MEPVTFLGTVVAAAPALVTSPFTMALISALGVLSATFGVARLREPGIVARRLGTYGQPAHSLEDFELQEPFRERVLAPLVRGCAGLVMKYTPNSTFEQYRRKLVLAGTGSMEARDFLGLKGLLALALGGGYLLFAGATRVGPSPVTFAVLFGVLGFYLPNLVLARKIARRQRNVQRALPDTLDLLTICVEAGLGFDAALQRVVEKRDDELSREMGRVLSEMRIGRSRRDALRALAERTDVGDVNTFIGAIVQSEQLGVSISRVLITQAEQMRVRRRQRAEELAHKAPIKMLFPMVFLIFPAMFVVLLGPTIPAIMGGLGSR